MVAHRWRAVVHLPLVSRRRLPEADHLVAVKVFHLVARALAMV